MNHVYAYIRVSTVKQGEKGSSLTEQRIAIEAYAKRHNLFIEEWFEERETAAKRGRVLFDRMMKLLLQGRATGIVIHKIDRGARNLRDWAAIGELVDKGIEVHFAHESLDMQSRGGRLAADIQAVVAADFIRNLRDEVRKGFNGRLRQGLYPLPAPIGYLDQGRGLPKTLDPVKAPLVEQAFSLYATGRYNLFTLGDELYRLGLRNRGGGRVTKSGLSVLLNNEFYIGVIFIRRTGERHLGIHEPLIRKHVYDQAQEILRGRTKVVGLRNYFPYRKTLKCSLCSYNLIAERQKGHVYYRCHTRDCARPCVREEVIDEHVNNALLRLRMTKEDITELEHEFRHFEQERVDQFEDALKSVELRVASIDDRRTRLTDAYIDKMIGKDVFEERNRVLLHERREACEQLDQIRRDPESFRARVKNFLELLKSLSRNVMGKTMVDSRNMLKETTSNLAIREKSLVVTWESPFDVVASHVEFVNGAPYRDGCRTEESELSRLARKLSTLFDETSCTDRSPSAKGV
jgi:site-specific DNA recombinase